MNGEPKFDTALNMVAALRALATQYARQLNSPNFKGSRRAQEAKLIGICTAIEVVTVNGNYYRERCEAFERVRGELERAR